MIMLSCDDDRIRGIASLENYSVLELLDPSKVKVFIAEESLVKLNGMARKTKINTLVKARAYAFRGRDSRP
jgi:hypothetical protein